jgi:hypothetical protein
MITGSSDPAVHLPPTPAVIMQLLPATEGHKLHDHRQFQPAVHLPPNPAVIMQLLPAAGGTSCMITGRVVDRVQVASLRCWAGQRSAGPGAAR